MVLTLYYKLATHRVNIGYIVRHGGSVVSLVPTHPCVRKVAGLNPNIAAT